MTKERSNFSSKIGFVLAAAGSAVGLGNIWRFPYLAAKYGGGIFLLVYLVLAVTFGFTLMLSEVAIGRKTGLSAVGAFNKLNKKFRFLGILSALVPIIIFPYYSVIGGWVIKYFTTFLNGGVADAANNNYFTNFISQPASPLFWTFLFIAFTSVIVLFGVKRGVEKASKILMPVLCILSLMIAVYCITLPGAMEGVIYYIKPDFSRFSAKTVVAALGQLFYSMSLAMGIMITYGSYLKKEDNLETSVRQIELFDTGIAFISGLMIIPAVFSFSGGDESVLTSGPGLMFQTLPKVFESMSFGRIAGTLFFLLVFFAALTSSISLMETIVSIIQDKLNISRKSTCLLVAAIALIMAVPSSMGFGLWQSIQFMGMSILDTFDFISNSILMPLVAFFTCIFIGYIIKPKAIIDEVKISSDFKAEKLFFIIVKYIAPICIIAILASSIFADL